MEQEHFTTAIINKTIENYRLEDAENLIKFIQNNPLNLGNASLARIAELTKFKKGKQCCILYEQVYFE